MKVAATRNETPPKFEPVTLSITFENETEIAAFFGMLSHTKLCGILRSAGVNPTSMRDAISKHHPRVMESYHEFHSKCCELMK